MVFGRRQIEANNEDVIGGGSRTRRACESK